MNMLWNLALSWVVSAGKGVGGGDLGNDIPVFCRETVFIPSITAKGPASKESGKQSDEICKERKGYVS